MDPTRLDRELMAAHEAGDKAALTRLYRRAGDAMLAQGDIDAGCFFMTQAYIFALDCGAAAAPEIRQILIRHGREE